MCTKDQPKEYIERGALIAALEMFAPGRADSVVNRLVRNITAADVVEVVRCKDCKYVKMLVDIIGEPHLFCCNGRSINRMKVEFDDYCSCGERKEEVKNG